MRTPRMGSCGADTSSNSMLKTFGALSADKQSEIGRVLIEPAERFSRGGDDTLIAPSEDREVVITKT